MDLFGTFFIPHFHCNSGTKTIQVPKANLYKSNINGQNLSSLYKPWFYRAHTLPIGKTKLGNKGLKLKQSYKAMH